MNPPKLLISEVNDLLGRQRKEKDNFVPSIIITRSGEMGKLKISRTFSEVVWSLWSLSISIVNA